MPKQDQSKYQSRERDNVVGQAIIFRYKKGTYNTPRNQELVYMREGYMRMGEFNKEEWELITDRYFLKVINLDEEEWRWVSERLGKITIHYSESNNTEGPKLFTAEE
jgi:hypothetical protein